MNPPRTFLLTVPKSKAKVDVTAQHLAQQGIAWEPFYGLDNSIFRLNTVDTFDVDRVGDSINHKQVAACMSHYLMWKVCSYLPEDSFWCLEDDVEFSPGWRQRYTTACMHLPDDWDIVFLGSCCCENRPTKDWGGGLYEVKYPLCGHALQIRKKAFKVLLDVHQRIWGPLDIAMMYESLPKLKVFSVLPRLCNQRATPLPP